MLNRSASLAISTSVLKALPGKVNLISKDTHLVFSIACSIALLKFLKKVKVCTVMPTKSDSDAILCLQSLSKTLTCTLHLS